MARLYKLTELTGKHLQAQPLPGKPLIEILGTNRVLIENHRGIVGYSLSEVTTRVDFGLIIISGDHLTLSMMNREQLVISGEIDSIQLFKKGSSPQ